MPKDKASEQKREAISEKSSPVDASSSTDTTVTNPTESFQPEPAPITQDQIIQKLLEQQSLLANELLELKQELQVSRQIQPMQGPQQGGLLGMIQSIAGPIGEALKRIPTGEGSGDSKLLQVFMDRLLARDALIDQVIMKQFQITPPAPHVVVRG
jgi:hypothetical protein